MTNLVLLDNPEDGIFRLLINRPDKRNAMDADVRSALRNALAILADDKACRAVVIGGVDGNFSAGGDLPSMVGISLTQARERMADVHATCRVIAAFPKPLVAAMEGYAVGAGIGLALLCDALIAGPTSKVMFPFLNLGLTPDWGSVHTLSQRIGSANARCLLTSGDTVAGEALFELGVADEYSEQAMDAAIARARHFAKLSPMAFAALKQRINQPSQTLDQELNRELDDQGVLLTSDDFREGYDAFVNKRKPEFK